MCSSQPQAAGYLFGSLVREESQEAAPPAASNELRLIAQALKSRTPRRTRCHVFGVYLCGVFHTVRADSQQATGYLFEFLVREESQEAENRQETNVTVSVRHSFST